VPLIVRVSKLLLRGLLFLAALGLLAVALCAWLLLSGPVSVAWLTPYLERELSTERLIVDIDGTQLRLGEDRSLDLRAVGVQVRAPDGRLLSKSPAVEIGLSTSALLIEQRIAVRRIDAVAPSLTLIRRSDGSIGLHEQPDAPAGDAFDIGAIVAGFLTTSDHRPSSYLEHIRFSGGELILRDQGLGRSLRARDAELMFAVHDDRASAKLALQVDQQAGSASLHVAATHEADSERIGVDVAFENLIPAEFADFSPDLPLSGMRLPFSGSARGAISTAGDLEPIGFDVETQDGVIELPRLGIGELPVDALWVQGTLAADLEEVVVDQLSFTTDGAHLSGWGEVAWRGGDPTLQANLEAQNVAIDHIASFWPPREGREARAWVIENIAGGTVPAARAQIRFGPGELGQKPLPEHTLAGEFVFEDLTVRYLDTMPPLAGVDGRATFTGQRMDFAVAGGRVGDLVVNQGAVVITGIGIKGRDTTQLEISTGISGPLEQALSLIDQQPLGYMSRAGIAPDQASGRVVSDLRIGMPLHRDFDPSEVRVAAEATITDAAITGQPVDIRDGRLNLTVAGDAVDLSGDAVVAGVPIAIDVEETLGGDGAHRRYRVSGSPDATLLRELGVDLPINLKGAIGVSATVTEAANGRTAEIALDLTPTTIEAPQLEWRKAAGQPGALTASATLSPGGPLRVTAFELTSDELRAEGSLEAQIEPFQLTRLWLDSVQFGDSRASIVLRQEDASGYEVRIDAETLDLTPWFGQDRPERTEKRGTAGLQVPWRLNLQAERLIVDTAALTAVNADLFREPDGWRSANLTGRLPHGGQLALTLAPAGERQKLRLTTTDAGDLLQALDTTSQIEGGELELDATIVRQQPNPEAEGRFVVREFTARNAPLLARLLTVASLQGIGNLLGGQGIAFQRLEAPFALRYQLLELGRGRLYGSQLGLTFEGWINLNDDTLGLGGTIVPLYGVNRTIGQIPIIGQLLRGSEGVGAFAFTYGVRGPIGDPTIRVNPLSALAPGFLRELFSGLREGTLEPPEMRPARDR
jgi:Protein of unknown function/AsmA-like C-terminal region